MHAAGARRTRGRFRTRARTLTSRTKPSSSGDARRRPLSWVSTSRNPGVNTHDVELRARAAPHVTLLTTTVIADPLSGRETGFVPSPPQSCRGDPAEEVRLPDVSDGSAQSPGLRQK